jgi:hypothetical protein
MFPKSQPPHQTSQHTACTQATLPAYLQAVCCIACFQKSPHIATLACGVNTQPISVGPIRWPSAHSTPQPADLAAARANRQLQEQQQQLEREQRLTQLQALAAADCKALQQLLLLLAAKARRLPRRVAGALLQGGQLGELLDGEVDWTAKVGHLQFTHI